MGKEEVQRIPRFFTDQGNALAPRQVRYGVVSRATKYTRVKWMYWFT